MIKLSKLYKKQLIKTLKTVKNRITKRELSIHTGSSLLEAEKLLLELAELTGAKLEVTDRGEIIYNFPTNWQQRLQQKNNQKWLYKFSNVTKNLLLFGIRAAISISFVGSVGLGLIISLFGLYLLVYIFLRILIGLPLSLLSGTFHLDLDLDWAGNFFSDGLAYGISSEVLRCLVDLLSWRYRGVSQKGFFAVFFSFIFGDGQKIESETLRWQAIANLIRVNQGAVIAEQVAPYLDSIANVEEEEYMIPVLNRFNGFPQVSDRGDLIYQFPDLQIGLESENDEANIDEVSYFHAPLHQFSRFKTNKIGSLLIINQLIWMFIAWAHILPGSYFVLLFSSILISIPAIRWLNLKIRNRKIARQNQKRHNLALRIKSQTQKLIQKFKDRKRFAKFTRIKDDDVCYRTRSSL
jgi:hypothetical protein